MATDIILSSGSTVQQSFTEDDQRMIVQPGVILSRSGGQTIYSSHADSELLNHGFILSTVLGVRFDGDDDVLHNFADGVVQAPNGAHLTGARASLVNAGAIVGSAGAAVEIEDPLDASISNTGTLSGTVYGVRFDGNGLGNAMLTNSGRIRSDTVGIDVSLETEATITVTNAAKGVISGTVWAVGVNVGILHLVNHGKIVGGINDSDGLRTTVRNDGVMVGFTFLGGGDDRFDGRGGVSDRVYGNGGLDVIIGGAKADWMYGGSDRDVLTGGHGADRFVFGSLTDSPVGDGRDLITDFRPGEHDRIDISDLAGDPFVFRGKGAFLGGGEPSIRYTQVNKPGTAHDLTIVHGDADGNGVTDFQIELKGLVALKAADFDL